MFIDPKILADVKETEKAYMAFLLELQDFYKREHAFYNALTSCLGVFYTSLVIKNMDKYLHLYYDNCLTVIDFNVPQIKCGCNDKLQMVAVLMRDNLCTYKQLNAANKVLIDNLPSLEEDVKKFLLPDQVIFVLEELKKLNSK